LKNGFSTSIIELKSNRTQNYARSKIKQLKLLLLSAVDEKAQKIFQFSNREEKMMKEKK